MNVNNTNTPPLRNKSNDNYFYSQDTIKQINNKNLISYANPNNNVNNYNNIMKTKDYLQKNNNLEINNYNGNFNNNQKHNQY